MPDPAMSVKVYGSLTGMMNAGKEVVGLATKYMAADAWANIKKEAPKDRGTMYGAFRLEKTSDIEWHILNALAYSVYQNDGTKPHYAPWGAIAAWAKRKGVAPFPVHYAIFVRGIKPKKYVEKGMEITNARLGEFMERAMKETLPKVEAAGAH